MAKDPFTEEGVARFLKIHRNDDPNDIIKKFIMMQAEMLSGGRSQDRMDELKALNILAMKAKSGELQRERALKKEAEEKRAKKAKEKTALERREKEEREQARAEELFLERTASRSRIGLLILEVLRNANRPCSLAEIRDLRPELGAMSVDDVQACLGQLAEDGCIDLDNDGRATFAGYVEVPRSLAGKGEVPDMGAPIAAVECELPDNWLSRRVVHP